MLEDKEIRLDLSISINNAYYFHIYRKSDNTHIGNCGLRLDSNETNNILGNIEYEIFKDYRGNNYAYQACLLLGEFATSKNVTKLIVTARPSNISSIKTIEKLGLKYLEVKKVPKNNILYKQGDRFVNVYEWNIGGEKNDRHKIN